MKLLVAFVPPSRLRAVLDLLQGAGVRSLSTVDAQGLGRRRGGTRFYRGQEYAVDFAPEVRLEIVLDDEGLEPVIEAIRAAGRTGTEGRAGDARVIVLPVEEALRIRTGQVRTVAP